MFDQVDFSALELPAAARALQKEVREFVRAEFASLPYVPQLGHTEFHPRIYAAGGGSRLDRHDVA